MLRRRLFGLFKIIVNPEQHTFLAKQYDLQEEEHFGCAVGTNIEYKNLDGLPYCKLLGKGAGTANIVIYNFTTTKPNQEVTFRIIAHCEENNDYIGLGGLDSEDIHTLVKKASGNEIKDHIYVVTNPGTHFVKIYYYEDSNNIISGNNCGYFYMVPYKNYYDHNIKKDSELIVNFKVYHSWEIKDNYPNWVTINKTYGTKGKNTITVTPEINNTTTKREGQIIIKDIINNNEGIINIEQLGENTEEYDIYTSYNNFKFSQDDNSNRILNIKLKGLDQFNISNVSSGISISPLTGTGISNDVNISIDGNSFNNNSTKSFRISGSENGTIYVIKDIILGKESAYCYCDSNQWNKCNCEIENFITHQDIDITPDPDDIYTGCDLHSTLGCQTYAECITDSTCLCDCNSQNTCPSKCGKCKCDGDTTCKVDCTPHVTDSCPSNCPLHTGNCPCNGQIGTCNPNDPNCNHCPRNYCSNFECGANGICIKDGCSTYSVCPDCYECETY